MAQFYVVRHGQASWGAANYDQLSALGAEQARRLGAHFAHCGLAFDQVQCGTLQRHRQTTEALLAGYGQPLPVVVDARLNEYDFEGLMQAAIEQGVASAPTADARSLRDALRDTLLRWAEDGIHGPLPERWADFQQRVGAWRAAVAGTGHRRVLAVSSGGAIAAMVQQVLRAPAATAVDLNLQIVNSGYCRFHVGSRGWSLGAFNATPHLEGPDGAGTVTFA